MKNLFSNDYADFWIENGILFFEYRAEVILNITAAEKVLADRLKFQAGKCFPILCDTRGIKDTDKAAREFLAREGSLFTSAVAFVVNHSTSKAITAFYIHMNRPRIPSRIFTDKYGAIKFLQAFLKKE